MKTSELSGAALDWAVATAEGFEVRWDAERKMLLSGIGFFVYAPSVDWSVGGPIIERERIAVLDSTDNEWEAGKREGRFRRGTTPLVAAMRCYVASKLGDEVNVPEELHEASK